MAILFLVFPNLKFSYLNMLRLKLLDQFPGSSLLQVLPPVLSMVDNIDVVLLLGNRLYLLIDFSQSPLSGDRNVFFLSELLPWAPQSLLCRHSCLSDSSKVVSNHVHFLTIISNAFLSFSA